MAKQRTTRSRSTSKTGTSTSTKTSSKSPTKAFHVEFLNQAQKMAWNAFEQHDVLFLLGPAGCGKALTLDAALYTRQGPIKMRDAQVGMEIANPDGGFSQIIGVFPQGKKDVYRVWFHDETYVDCCKEHLWNVSSNTNGWKNKVVDTQCILENHRSSSGRRHIFVEATKPVEFDRKEYLIEPYTMGVLLSEGNFTNANVVFTTVDSEIFQKVAVGLPEDYCCKSKGIDHRIVKTKRGNQPNIYKEELKSFGLWGKYAYEKHIPEEYLCGAVHQRISLLQGLMDGDGTVEKTGKIEYATSSSDLAHDMELLVNSLGGICRKTIKECPAYNGENGELRIGRPSYRLTLCMPNEIKLFMLSRKVRLRKPRTKYFPKRIIDRVEKLENKQEMQCVSVDHERSLYLTDNYTVTHNTHLGCAFALSEVLAKRKEKIFMTRPILEAGESLGFLPGDMAEKVDPYMRPMRDCIDKCVGKENSTRERLDKCMEVAPLAYMRGRTFDDSVCIFDEAQNATYNHLKLFLTRFGQNSKIIITGDPRQSDLPGGDVPLVNVVRRLESLQGIGVIRFKHSSIVRHPLVGAIIEQLEREEE